MKALLAEFDSPEALISAAKKLADAGHPPADTFTPFPVEEAMALVAAPKTSLKRNMAIAGFGMAVFAFALQYYGAAVAYPYDSGSRPLFSWPVFWLVAFETGILAAAIAGFATLLYESGLPGLYHPLFEYRHIERANDDRFFLAVDADGDDGLKERLRRLIEEEHALSIEEVRL